MLSEGSPPFKTVCFFNDSAWRGLGSVVDAFKIYMFLKAFGKLATLQNTMVFQRFCYRRPAAHGRIIQNVKVLEGFRQAWYPSKTYDFSMILLDEACRPWVLEFKSYFGSWVRGRQAPFNSYWVGMILYISWYSALRAAWLLLPPPNRKGVLVTV